MTQEECSTVDAVVVGAGFAGLYMLHRLRAQGLSVQGIEAAPSVGGTWWWNCYPGARCDVESMQYSYSFSDELQQDWNWSERYATQPEILEYLNHVADRFDLRRHIRLDTRVVSAVFDEAAGRWMVRTSAGAALSARFCIMATGCLSEPKRPDVAGADSFAGRTLQTARWPRAGVSFTGRRVGVIGTGSTAIQAIPLIADQAASLHVFQRTPNFSVPAHNAPLQPAQVQETKAHYARLREEARHTSGGIVNPRRGTVSALAVDPDQRRRDYEAAWAHGGIGFQMTYTDMLTNAAANETAAEYVRERIREIVRDPATAEALCPSGHPLGAKRLSVDTDYYRTFNRDNVALVDLRQSPIERITPAGVRAGGREYPLDDLVFATGFDAMTGALLAIDIRGRGGLTLARKWADGPRTYLGLGISGFPNLFVVAGPGSPSVLSNMVVSIEQHVEWISDCIAHARRLDCTCIEAEEEAEGAWVDHVNAVADGTLFPRAGSWYVGANVPGKPRVFMPYVGGVGNYRAKCDDIAARGYPGFTLR